MSDTGDGSSPVLLPGQIIYDCSGGNGYDGRDGLRISSIFVIGFGSLLGMLLPSSIYLSFLFPPPMEDSWMTQY
jgi:hypothetical protein